MNRVMVSVFGFEGREIRTVARGGEPWFVARDVATALGYTKPENAIAAHCKATLKQGIPSAGGEQETIIIPERDVYRLIMRSKLPAAERFEEWVVSEVLPAIRKTGQYTTRKQHRPEVEAAEIFPSFHRIARLLGLDRSRAALAASTAMEQITGVDLLALMDVRDVLNDGGEITLENNTLLRGLVQLLDADGAAVRDTFKGVLDRVAAIVGPALDDDTFPTPHTFRRHLERLRPALAEMGIAVSYGGHTNRGYVVELSQVAVSAGGEGMVTET